MLLPASFISMPTHGAEENLFILLSMKVVRRTLCSPFSTTFLVLHHSGSTPLISTRLTNLGCICLNWVTGSLSRRFCRLSERWPRIRPRAQMTSQHVSLRASGHHQSGDHECVRHLLVLGRVEFLGDQWCDVCPPAQDPRCYNNHGLPADFINPCTREALL
jgi:hypothetical protein